MIDVMIVDDETFVRERLKSNIDWNALPLRLSCEAGDGDSARELYLIHRPKIIITDINIPIVSGLDLIEELQKEDPELLFIVITGYTDFEMAKRSLNLRAFRLLSKPIFAEGINACLSDAVAHLEEQRKKKASQQVLRQLVMSNLPQMQETFMANLLRQPPKNPALIPMKITQLKIPCAGPFYTVVLIRLHINSADMDNKEAIFICLRDALCESLSKNGLSAYSFMDNHFRLNCVISAPSDAFDDTIERILISISEQMSFLYNAALYAGIGTTVAESSRLSESYTAALTTLNYQCTLKGEHVTHSKNLQKTDASLFVQKPLIEYLLQKFREGSCDVIADTISKRVEMLGIDTHDGRRQVRLFFFEYLTTVITESVRMGLELKQMGDYSALMLRLFQKENLGECQGDICSLTKHLIDELQKKQIASSNYLIAMAKQYIQENLANKELDLDMVSDHIGLSKNYFCKLFHQVEEVSFGNYLKQVRVEYAKNLLCTTSMKVFEISEACGFSNAKYFGYAFRQAVGQTPLDYQRDNGK